MWACHSFRIAAGAERPDVHVRFSSWLVSLVGSLSTREVRTVTAGFRAEVLVVVVTGYDERSVGDHLAAEAAVNDS